MFKEEEEKEEKKKSGKFKMRRLQNYVSGIYFGFASPSMN